MNQNRQLGNKRVAVLYLLGFLLIFGYAFARPCIDSIFLEHYSNEDLPSAWLITAFASVFVIALYNATNQKWAILPLYGLISILSALSLSLLIALYLLGFSAAIFILYIWKEIYMVVLVETYWSYADIVFSTKTARKKYGRAMAMSSFGGILGNFAVWPLTQAFGAKTTLSFLILLLLLGALIAHYSKDVSDEKPKSKEKKDFTLGVSCILKSKYLVPLAFLILTVQIVVGLIDYKFNGLLKEYCSNTDERTILLGQIHASVNIFSISLQMLTNYILKAVGVGITFFSIPAIVGFFIAIFVVLPKFAFMMAIKVSSKALDYSLLRAVKEMLYIPLSRGEKTQGKGLIDIFFYRLAKGLSSLILLLITYFALDSYVMELSLLLVSVWMFLSIIIAKRYGKLVNQK